MAGVFVVDYARSPFAQTAKGAFAGVHPDDLAARVIRILAGRATFDINEIEDVILGCAFREGEQGLNIGLQQASRTAMKSCPKLMPS